MQKPGCIFLLLRLDTNWRRNRMQCDNPWVNIASQVRSKELYVLRITTAIIKTIPLVNSSCYEICETPAIHFFYSFGGKFASCLRSYSSNGSKIAC